MYASPLNSYRETSIQTARPIDLLLMLYNGAIRFSHSALMELERDDIEEVHHNIVRVQDIVSELRSSLNFEAGEIAQHLAALYDYMFERLIEANVKKQAEPLREVTGMLEELRNTWAELAKSPNLVAVGGVNVAK